MVTDRLNGLCAIVDSATHLGGNEFSVILPAVDGPGAMQFSSALQSALGSGPLTPGAIDEAVLSVFGVASIPETCGNPETLLAAARQAKEMAKTAPQPIVLFPVDSEF